MSLFCPCWSASIYEAWRLYQGGDYRGALLEYQRVLQADPENVDAIHGTINCNAMLHNYREAESWCDSLAQHGVPTESVDLKKKWVQGIYTANHLFGISLLGGPLFYSHGLIQDDGNRYVYDQGKYSEIESWFTWNGHNTFSASASHFTASFRPFQPDSLWYGVKYLDTLYASLGQKPRTAQYVQGDFTNTFGNPDTFYTDYSQTPLGESKSKPNADGYDNIVSASQPVIQPQAVYQNQMRLGWKALYPKRSFGAALTVGRSNILGQRWLANGWTEQGFSFLWFDLVLQESALKLDKAMFVQLSPEWIRNFAGWLFTITPTWIGQAAHDAVISVPDNQWSGAAMIDKTFSIWSLSLNGSWGEKAYASAYEGRSLATLELPHRKSYGATLSVRPWQTRNLKLYILCEREDYSVMTRSLAILGTAYQW